VEAEKGEDQLSNQELAVIDEHMPVMNIDAAHERWETIRSFVSKIMTPDEDFGIVPGAGSRPCLLKPGAEKLAAFFGLAPEFDVVQRIEEWNSPEPFFHYEVKCRLSRGGQLRGEGLGSCNSREAKYRWRTGERSCPVCGAAAIIKGKQEYGGGYLCFGKKGGCGAKFPDGDLRIEGQQTGRVPNPDIADSVNTVLKMAKKRALVDAVLSATGASQFFVADTEDLTPADIPRVPRQENLSPMGDKARSSGPIILIPQAELEVIQAGMRDRSTIGSALHNLLESLSAQIGEEAARAQFDKLLTQYNASKWEELRSVKTAHKFAGDLYALIQQAPEPAEVFDE
jgi:hypothetical protein